MNLLPWGLEYLDNPTIFLSYIFLLIFSQLNITVFGFSENIRENVNKIK